MENVTLSCLRKTCPGHTIHRYNRWKRDLIAPPKDLFFVPRVKLGFCLIRRHGCPRNSENQDAASSPQSTVSTLGEGEGIRNTRGKSAVSCSCLFLAIQDQIVNFFCELSSSWCHFYQILDVAFFFSLKNCKHKWTITQCCRVLTWERDGVSEWVGEREDVGHMTWVSISYRNFL